MNPYPFSMLNHWTTPRQRSPAGVGTVAGRWSGSGATGVGVVLAVASTTGGGLAGGGLVSDESAGGGASEAGMICVACSGGAMAGIAGSKSALTGGGAPGVALVGVRVVRRAGRVTSLVVALVGTLLAELTLAALAFAGVGVVAMVAAAARLG